MYYVVTTLHQGTTDIHAKMLPPYPFPTFRKLNVEIHFSPYHVVMSSSRLYPRLDLGREVVPYSRIHYHMIFPMPILYSLLMSEHLSDRSIAPPRSSLSALCSSSLAVDSDVIVKWFKKIAIAIQNGLRKSKNKLGIYQRRLSA